VQDGAEAWGRGETGACVGRGRRGERSGFVLVFLQRGGCTSRGDRGQRGDFFLQTAHGSDDNTWIVLAVEIIEPGEIYKSV